MIPIHPANIYNTTVIAALARTAQNPMIVKTRPFCNHIGIGINSFLALVYPEQRRTYTSKFRKVRKQKDIQHLIGLDVNSHLCEWELVVIVYAIGC
jgi:hypothetical protein